MTSRSSTPTPGDEEWTTRRHPYITKFDRRWNETMSAAKSLLFCVVILFFYLFERKNALKLLEKLKNSSNPVIEKCRQTFTENQCGRKTIEPAIAEICARAKKCLKMKPTLPSTATIIFSSLGDACNEFLSNLAPSTVTTILLLLFVLIAAKRYI